MRLIQCVDLSSFPVHISTQSVKGLSRKLNFFSKKGLKIRFFFLNFTVNDSMYTKHWVSSCDSRVFNEPLGRSLHSFTRTAHSAHLLSSIRLASSTGWLTHFDHSLCSLCSLTSLPHGMVEIHKCPDLYPILFISRKAVFSRRHATLHLPMSVSRFVGR